jgi:predicted DCC family thiol-disulfide oxidoreductase YuxK
MPGDALAQGRLTVLYDEACGFCTAIATWLVGRGAGRLRAEPIGSAFGARALRDLPMEHRYDSVHAIDGLGRRWSGARSLPVLARATPGFSWAAEPLALLPQATELGYDWVARHRAALSRLLRLLGRMSRTRHELGTRPHALAR